MIEGLFVKLERYAPKWAIRLAVWSVIIVAVSQGMYAGYGLGLWLLTPLAQQGWSAEEYAKIKLLLDTSLTVLFLIVFLWMSKEYVRMKWRHYRFAEDILNEDLLKQNYLLMFKHAEDYHPEIWNEIIDELNERRKAKADE